MNLIPYGYLDVNNIYQPNFNLMHEEIVELLGKPFYEKEQFENLFSAEKIGLLTTDPKFSHIESPLLLEFAREILRKAQEK